MVKRCSQCGRLPLVSQLPEQTRRKLIETACARPLHGVLEPTDVKYILNKAQYKSMWSGNTANLTIVPLIKTQPVSVQNAILLTKAESEQTVPESVYLAARRLLSKRSTPVIMEDDEDEDMLVMIDDEDI
jgi:hypothetical protein